MVQLPALDMRLSERARRVLNDAEEEAKRFNHNYIGTEHILLGLTKTEDGLAAQILKSLGVTVAKARSGVEFIIGRGEKAAVGEMGMTPRAKKVIELALEEARRLNDSSINEGHILLGLVREGEGIAFGVLESLGVSSERIRAEHHRILQTQPQSPENKQNLERKMATDEFNRLTALQAQLTTRIGEIETAYEEELPRIRKELEEIERDIPEARGKIMQLIGATTDSAQN